MPRLNLEDRNESLRLARVSSTIEGLRADPEAALDLGAYAAGVISRVEFDRRVRERIAHENAARVPAA